MTPQQLNRYLGPHSRYYRRPYQSQLSRYHRGPSRYYSGPSWYNVRLQPNRYYRGPHSRAQQHQSQFSRYFNHPTQDLARNFNPQDLDKNRE